MKGNIFLGTARGKLGDFVGKVVHGKQIYAKYQPNVANPKTYLQRRTRNVFTLASKMMAKIREELTGYGIRAVYTTYSGASKSLQNIVFPWSAKHAQINIGEAPGQKLPGNQPLLIKTITGNNLDLSISLPDGSLVIGAKSGLTGPVFFGSDSFIDGTRLVGVAIKSYPFSVEGVLDIKEMSSTSMVLQENALYQSLPRGYGFKNSIDQVGGWPFVYATSLPIVLSTAIGALMFTEAEKQYGAIGILYDNVGRIICADSVNEFQSV